MKKRPKKGARIDAKNQEFTKCCFYEKRRFTLEKQHFLKAEASKSHKTSVQKTIEKHIRKRHAQIMKNTEKGTQKGR